MGWVFKGIEDRSKVKKKMECQNTTISRSYLVTQKEIKEKLKIKGDIQEIALWSGLSQNEVDEEVTQDKCIYEIVTHEVNILDKGDKK